MTRTWNCDGERSEPDGMSGAMSPSRADTQPLRRERVRRSSGGTVIDITDVLAGTAVIDVVVSTRRFSAEGTDGGADTEGGMIRKPVTGEDRARRRELIGEAYGAFLGVRVVEALLGSISAIRHGRSFGRQRSVTLMVAP